MSAAIALRQDTLENQRTAENERTAWTRDAVLSRYRRLRAIGRRLNEDLVASLSGDTVLHYAGRLGIASGRTLLLDSLDDLNFAFDLAIHTAPPGRSRAIERYAAAKRLPAGSDEAIALDAMRRARFTIYQVERRHEAAGLIIRDVFRRTELWLVDEGLEMSLRNGTIMAARLYAPEAFAMTTGVNVPVDSTLLLKTVDEVPQLDRKATTAVLDDRRFAEAMYRIALADGRMECFHYCEVPATE